MAVVETKLENLDEKVDELKLELHDFNADNQRRFDELKTMVTTMSANVDNLTKGQARLDQRLSAKDVFTFIGQNRKLVGWISTLAMVALIAGKAGLDYIGKWLAIVFKASSG